MAPVTPGRPARLAPLLAGLLACSRSSPALQSAQDQVSFPTRDGGLIVADGYGSGDRGIVLAHGGRFNKESWAPQARALADAGFRVLALNFRGYGPSRGPGASDPLGAPLHLDLLAAVEYLRGTGVTTVSLIGGSMGADAAARAAIEAEPGAIDALVLLAGGASEPPERLPGRKLFVVSRDDRGPGGVPRLIRIRAQYEGAREPKELLILDGSAHAQFLFPTDQGPRLICEIIRFLSLPAGAPAGREPCAARGREVGGHDDRYPEGRVAG